jgi:ubiquinone/menaquinone biosynthesis C-methylase UbiE
MRGDRFEGLYGRLYNTVIQTPTIRHAVFTLWGSADPLLNLDDIVRAAAAETGDGTVLDVPCGGGTLLPLLSRAGFRGNVIGTDAADAMIRRARRLHDRTRPPFAVELIQADARALPLPDASIDTAISINGLHVIPRPDRFLAELARVLRPGGALWLITPVSSTDFRSRVILTAAGALSITPAAPPTLPQLRWMLDDAGLPMRRSLGGTSIVGMVCERPHTAAGPV